MKEKTPLVRDGKAPAKKNSVLIIRSVKKTTRGGGTQTTEQRRGSRTKYIGVGRPARDSKARRDRNTSPSTRKVAKSLKTSPFYTQPLFGNFF